MLTLSPGSTITKDELKRWVDYARDNKALILYDAAYEAFIRDASLPKSIFEIDGAKTSEIGRFAITRDFDDIGSFKTPTLRNIALTAPYMHDGSIETLEDVVIHYMNGGVTEAGDPVNDFLSGGIRPLNIELEDVEALVAFMEALTSPEIEAQLEAAEAE